VNSNSFTTRIWQKRKVPFRVFYNLHSANVQSLHRSAPINGFPRPWNDSEVNQIKSISSKNEFNTKFKNHYLDQLADNYSTSAEGYCTHTAT
jgi:hypothetical protein